MEAVDSSGLIAAERRKLTPAQVIEDVVKKVAPVPVILSAWHLSPRVNIKRGLCDLATAGKTPQMAA